MTQPRPVGDPLTAYRRVLARARHAEAENKALRARLHAITGTFGTAMGDTREDTTG